jgi:MoxR-like ATPase
MTPEVFRHRILLSYEAEAEGKTTDDIVDLLLERVEVP